MTVVASEKSARVPYSRVQLLALLLASQLMVALCMPMEVKVTFIGA